jgi:hypothetical protein
MPPRSRPRVKAEFPDHRVRVADFRPLAQSAPNTGTGRTEPNHCLNWRKFLATEGPARQSRHQILQSFFTGDRRGSRDRTFNPLRPPRPPVNFRGLKCSPENSTLKDCVAEPGHGGQFALAVQTRPRMNANKREFQRRPETFVRAPKTHRLVRITVAVGMSLFIRVSSRVFAVELNYSALVSSTHAASAMSSDVGRIRIVWTSRAAAR